MMVYKKRNSRMIFFGFKEFFAMNFDLKNGCKNEFKDNYEKLWSWSRNRVSQKIDFKSLLPRNGHAANVGIKGFLLWNKKFGFRFEKVFVLRRKTLEFLYKIPFSYHQRLGIRKEFGEIKNRVLKAEIISQKYFNGIPYSLKFCGGWFARLADR